MQWCAVVICLSPSSLNNKPFSSVVAETDSSIYFLVVIATSVLQNFLVGYCLQIYWGFSVMNKGSTADLLIVKPTHHAATLGDFLFIHLANICMILVEQSETTLNSLSSILRGLWPWLHIQKTHVGWNECRSETLLLNCQLCLFGGQIETKSHHLPPTRTLSGDVIFIFKTKFSSTFDVNYRG